MANNSLYRDMVTDYNGKDGDTGRSLTVFVVGSMIIMQSFALWKGQPFEPMSFGGGIAAVLGALGVYLWGDNNNRPGTKRTTSSESASEVTTIGHPDVPNG